MPDSGEAQSVADARAAHHGVMPEDFIINMITPKIPGMRTSAFLSPIEYLPVALIITPVNRSL